ncbi:MAG: chromosomal replication initiator DnaA [Hyphomonadaceae bacterium]|nr:chromosomal replication initiator DnaA [Hyphomonadaceae bacterium]
MGVLSKRAEDAAAAELAANVVGYALCVPGGAIVDEARGCSKTAYARQIAMYLCHVAFELSLARVAIAFGRDRSTVAHACHAIEDRRDEPQFDLWIGSIEASLRAAPSPIMAQCVSA